MATTGDENGTLQHGETLALEHVDLEVEHGGPDQHGREDLDESETPVREQEPNTLEQHCEGTHQEAERRQQPVPAAQVDEDCLDRLVVTVPDGGNEPRPSPSHLPRARNASAARRWRLATHSSAQDLGLLRLELGLGEDAILLEISQLG